MAKEFPAGIRYKPEGRFIPLAYHERLTPILAENASHRRWRSFSPEMWRLYLGFVLGLQQPFIWEGYPDELHQILVDYLSPEEPPETECPECPEPEPPPAPQQPSGGTSGGESIGSRTGLSLAELEDFFMSWSLRGQLKWVGGVLCYWSEGCCDWIPIEGEAGAAPPALTSESVSAIANGVIGLEQWAATGQPDVGASIPPVPSENPFYTTDDSMACVKASAFIDEMRRLFTVVRDGLEVSEETLMGHATWVTVLINFAAPGLATGVSSGAAYLFSKMVGRSKTETVSQLTDALSNDNLALWNNAVCSLVPLMDSVVTVGFLNANKATDDDYQATVNTIIDIVNPGDHVVQIMNTFPIGAFLDRVLDRLPTQECNCSQYLPHGYTPVAPGNNALQFAQPASVTTWDDSTWNSVLGRSGAFTHLEWVSQWQDAINIAGNLFKPVRQFRADTDRGHLGGGLLYQFANPIVVNSVTMRSFGELANRHRVVVFYADGTDEFMASDALNGADNVNAEHITQHDFIAGKEATHIWINYIQRSGTGQPFPSPPGEFELVSAVVNSDTQGQITIAPNTQFAD